MTGEMKVNPEKITITGAESKISQIKKAEAKINVDGLSKDTEVEAELVLYDAAENVISQSQLSNNLGSEGITVDVEVLQKRAFRYSSVCQESRQRDIVIRDAPVNLPVSRSVEKVRLLRM